MMNMTDPIADMLTRIRNGVQARHESVEVPASKVKIEIAKILKNEGFILNYAVSGETPAEKKITITLKYGPNNEKVISGIKRISKKDNYYIIRPLLEGISPTPLPSLLI